MRVCLFFDDCRRFLQNHLCSMAWTSSCHNCHSEYYCVFMFFFTFESWSRCINKHGGTCRFTLLFCRVEHQHFSVLNKWACAWRGLFLYWVEQHNLVSKSWMRQNYLAPWSPMYCGPGVVFWQAIVRAPLCPTFIFHNERYLNCKQQRNVESR